MVLKYFRKTGEYIVNGDWDGDEGYDFEYEPESQDLHDALVEIVTNYFYEDILKVFPELKEKLAKKVEEIIDKHDLEDDLAEAFEEELTDWFEYDAQASEGGI